MLRFRQPSSGHHVGTRRQENHLIRTVFLRIRTYFQSDFPVKLYANELIVAESKSTSSWPVRTRWCPTWTSRPFRPTTAACTSASRRPRWAPPSTRPVSTSSDCPSSDPWTKSLSSLAKWCTSPAPSLDTPSNPSNGRKVTFEWIQLKSIQIIQFDLTKNK